MRLPSRTALCGGLCCLAALLAGCGATTPLVQQLKAERVERLTLVVEQAPPRYSAPALPDAPFTGASSISPSMLENLGVQQYWDKAHARLDEAARVGQLTADHHQAFRDLLVKRFADDGIAVDVVPAPYGEGNLSSRRVYYTPTRAAAQALRQDVPSVYLTLNFGSCTVPAITPCASASINSTGVVTSPGPNQKYRGAFVLEPNLFVLKRSDVMHFKNINGAVVQIADFDAALGALVPGTVDRLVQVLREGPPPRR